MNSPNSNAILWDGNMLVWYFVLSLSNGVVAIPQVNHDQCIQNRDMVKKSSVWGNGYCFAGAAGVPPIVSSSHKDDDDD